MTITVYSKPNCGGCNLTIQMLKRNKTDFTVVDITQSEEALTTVKELGYLAAPVVVTDTDHWTGFRPDKLAALGK